MYWINPDQLRNTDDSISHNQSSVKPAKRWGQSCVAAHNKLYIIGGYEGSYLGDVWEFDFATLQYTEMRLDTAEPDILSRSNHTAIFYEKHNSIYVFGGGQAQKQRFNDTIKLEFIESTSSRRGHKTLKVEKLSLAENSPMPQARTYHASCLLGKYMIIVGGEATTDLKDLWALDLERKIWYNPQINFLDLYAAKRFHTVTTINDHQVITFGGCHNEYVHLNEMHSFDLSDFLKNPDTFEASQIECKQINVSQGTPSTRWGHAATNYKGKLYIVGGRNENDINDIHEYNPVKNSWKQLEIYGPLPKPRRRHSALFVSGAIVMFGGFDGSFFDDLHILDLQSASKQIIHIQTSSINFDYLKLVGSDQNTDITFILDNPQEQKVPAHKALVLFRLIKNEFQAELHEEQKFRNIVNNTNVSEFIRNVYLSKQGDEINLKGISCKQTFLKVLEYLYCDRFIEMITTTQVKKVCEVFKHLGLFYSYQFLRKKAEYGQMRLKQTLIQDLQQVFPNQDMNNIKEEENKQALRASLKKMEDTVKLDFSHVDDIHIQSPEDRQERLQNKAQHLMNQCKNLDEFYDVLFHVEDTLIKANTIVLSARCPYFNSMLSSQYSFKESLVDRSGYIRVTGVPKLYFSCIIQYIYSDHFYIQKYEAEFFIKLMMYADYFLLPRLIDICSSYLKKYVNEKSALQIFLLAHAHNADQLEKYCINFICLHEQEILSSRHFRNFKRKAQEQLVLTFYEKLEQEKQESYVFIQINNYLTKKNQTDQSSNYSQSTNYNANYSQQDAQRRNSRSQQSTYQGQNQNVVQQQPLRSSCGNYMNGSSYRGLNIQKEQDEIESKIQEIMQDSLYIYLEEHQSFESYDHSKFMKPFNTSSFEMIQEQYLPSRMNVDIEDSKDADIPYLPHSSARQSKNKSHMHIVIDKENQHPNIMQNVLSNKLSKIGQENTQQQVGSLQIQQQQQKDVFRVQFSSYQKKQSQLSIRRQPLKNVSDNLLSQQQQLQQDEFNQFTQNEIIPNQMERLSSSSDLFDRNSIEQLYMDQSQFMNPQRYSNSRDNNSGFRDENSQFGN
ncbi:kelch repeat [Stylonychia lemnae]|uniref:Kelch repeat n=1 Tax=Stylonychia lemnae TaxID=5949 RepID=A0A077ZQ28_STYLE|nr:kelch repeat [Stylonychia lemnae]|eukprot:CDW71485.1 kelch repeat [Stylonychia lemnae]